MNERDMWVIDKLNNASQIALGINADADEAGSNAGRENVSVLPTLDRIEKDAIRIREILAEVVGRIRESI